MITRPLGDQVGPSAWNEDAEDAFGRPVRLHGADMELPGRRCLVKAIESPLGDQTGVE